MMNICRQQWRSRMMMALMAAGTVAEFWPKMARKTQESKRKRAEVPNEAYRFISNLEKLLKLDNSSNEEQSPPPVTDSNDPFMGAMDLLGLEQGGLENVDSSTLRRAIDPIWKSLESLDAVSMLNLERCEQGARLSDGVFVKPIHDKVTPIRHRKGMVVRYVHVSEVPDKYSVGIFIFPPHARIPLHDHPHMCVLSRVLYGDLERTSLDLAREDQLDASSWFPRFTASMNKRPNGSRRAYLNGKDYLQAPNVTALYPFEGQLHEFRAGPHGAAVLDVLLPPYDEDHDRDCTFYKIEPDSNALPGEERRQPCWIVPTRQPDDFHCLSGRYNELGGDYFDSDDSSDTS